MINREEITENIKRLLQGYADTRNDISITRRNPYEAEVYIDGKYFNTYLVKEKKFKHNIVRPADLDEEFKITVILSRDDLAEIKTQYKGAELQLPATENEIKDAFERARINNENQHYTMKGCRLYEFDLATDIKAEMLDLTKLNYLARVMSRFSIYEHRQFRGYREKKGLSLLDIDGLINIAYNLDGCEVIDTIFNAEALGKMYVDNAMLEWIPKMPKEAWGFLNYNAIGEKLQTTQDGLFTEDGYFTCNEEMFTELYDGVNFPEDFDDDKYIFKLYITPKKAETEKPEKWLTLPVSKEGKANFLKEIGAESFDDCILLAVQSMESNIPMCIKDLSQLGLLNSLAHRMRDMEKSGELAKFKAVLEGFGCEALDTAIGYANKLQDFVLYPESSSAIEYAKEVYKEVFGEIVPEEFEKHFNFASYSVDLMNTEKIAVTEYGVIKDKSGRKETSTQDDNE